MRLRGWLLGLLSWFVCVIAVFGAGCTLQIRATELEIEGELVKRYEFEGIAIDGLKKGDQKAYAGTKD